MSLPFGAVKPGIDVTLPHPIVLPGHELILFYASLLLIDYTILCNESRIPLTATQLRVAMALVHATIPQIVVSPNVSNNMFFATFPWFLVSYCASLPMERLTLKETYDAFMKVILDPAQTVKNSKRQNRWNGCVKFARGTSKLIFLSRCIEPWLPKNNAYLLSLAWFDWRSLMLTILYGIKGYCFLGVVDIGMGIQQFAFGEPIIDLFNSPIISSSPRDFWSRRWNKAVRNLLHHIIFMQGSQPGNKKAKGNEKAAPSKDVLGMLVFVVSGVFHELLILSMFRKMTLENLTFFTLQGIAVYVQLTVRKSATWTKQDSQGLMRVLCVGLHLMFLAVTGRFFLAPYLRYYDPTTNPYGYSPAQNL